MPELSVIDELAAYLVAQAVAQLPGVAPSINLPSVWVDPADGAPEPRDGENATITLRDTLLQPPSDLEPWMEEAFVDVTVRARATVSPLELFIQRTIRSLLAPVDLPGGRKQWMMGALLVETSTTWRGDQRLPGADMAGRPASPTVPTAAVITMDRVQSFRVACRRKSLSGLPYVP